jgi:hypothetical protein
MGSVTIETNMTTVSWSGGSDAFTNVLETGETSGSIHVVYDFYSLPDEMTIYHENALLFDSGMVSGSLVTDLNYGPGSSTSIQIVMNENGNPDIDTAWYYRVSSTHVVPVFFTFTEDRNRAALPIKFAPPPFTNANYTTQGSTPAVGIYYLPEQSLEQLKGETAEGVWTLEVEDTRAGAATPAPALLGWTLELNLRRSVPAPLALTPSLPSTNILSPNQIQWFAVSVPPWASFATNRLLFAEPALNLLFNPAVPPTGTNLLDSTLLLNSRAGVTVLSTNGAAFFVPGGRYFLGVQNTNSSTLNYALQVDFDVAELQTLQSGISFSSVTMGQEFFRFPVSSNALRAQFEINQPSCDLTLLLRKGLPLPGFSNFDYISANPGTNDEMIVLRESSLPVPLTPGDWFVGVFNPWGLPASYSLLATEFASAGTNLNITGLTFTNGNLCLTWDSLPGACYVVEGTAGFDVPNWIPASPTIRASDLITTFCAPWPSPFQFFRVREGIAPEPVPLQILSVLNSNDGVRLRWSADAPASFGVQWTASLNQNLWNSFTNTVTSSSSVFEFLDDGSQTAGLNSPRFYRLLRLP